MMTRKDKLFPIIQKIKDNVINTDEGIEAICDLFDEPDKNKFIRELILSMVKGVESPTGNDVVDKALEICEMYFIKTSNKISFEQILREEFLVNTENYPKEYHKLFKDKFDNAYHRFNNEKYQ